MALIRKSQPISLINQDQRGTSFSLMRNQGSGGAGPSMSGGKGATRAACSTHLSTAPAIPLVTAEQTADFLLWLPHPTGENREKLDIAAR
jgi:hypothetical protein